MLVVWVRCGGWAHVSNVPHPFAQDGPSGRVHVRECAAVDQSWVFAVHQRDAQDEAANAAMGVLLTVRGGDSK
jgi:hypothetical protein